MPSDTPAPPPSEPGLPPVTPPSVRIILRDFLVPGLIVVVLVFLFLAGPPLSRWIKGLFGISPESHGAEAFLRRLDDTNSEIRWRAASDLSQELLRDDHLAADGIFALQLADRLQKTVTSSAAAEKAAMPQLPTLKPEEARRERKKLEPERNYIQFLSACLGNFMVPVGAPILKELAVQQDGLEPEALGERRRQAVWALANLGRNLERFDALSGEQKTEVIDRLETAARQGEHSSWARTAQEYLQRQQEGRPDVLGIDKTMETCAEAEDPALREVAALAMNFWSGTAVENAHLEAILVKLSHDSGRGEDQLARLVENNEDSKDSRAVTKKPGFRVQANATIALARRGSPKVRLDLLQEMLDEKELRKIFLVEDRKTGFVQPEEALVVLTVENTLKALVKLHQKRPEMNLSSLMPIVEDLTRSSNQSLRASAEETRLALGK
jgi:hypothetical protein